MKQLHQLALNLRGQIRSLVKIAPMTGETQIGQVVRSIMLPGDNVVDMESHKGNCVLVTSAVFTAIPGSQAYQSASCCIDRHLSQLEAAAMTDRALT